MMREVPWQTGEICGPKSARGLKKAHVIERDWKKAEKPILVVGSEALEIKHGEGDMIDYAIALSKAGGIPIIATSNTIKAFLERGFEDAVTMGAMEVPHYLCDPDWKGPHNKGPHDMLLIFGIPYYMEWCMLSALMNFAPHITLITLDRYYHPHAKWSFPNMKETMWHEQLDEIMKIVGGK